MNKSQRIKVDLDNNQAHYVRTRLDQSTKTLEILSLEIDQKDIYQNFNADYGVLVGRVLANGEVGISNAKISIFIPIDDDDKNRGEIVALYPYEKPYDKNRDGKRYNLLPRVGQSDPNSGGSIKPKQPFGSFSTKEETVSNETILEVYDKYYKYSTVTNDSGDYMLFGVPIGVQTVHMSVDVTDIGQYSMTPLDMVTQLGYSENLFTSTGAIKPQRNLEDLPHIETQEISVDVIPFWGDKENFEIGITRQDFRIRAVLISNFYVFGSYFTMGRESLNGNPDAASRNPSNNAFDDGWYRLDKYTAGAGDYNNDVDFRTNRGGDLSTSVYYYPSNIDQDTIDNDIITSGTTIDPQSDIIKLDENSYNFYNDGNSFIVSVPCNRRKIITDEFGNEVVVPDDNVNGVFTEFLGMMFFEMEDLATTKTYEYDWQQAGIGTGVSSRKARLRFKYPQDIYSIRAEEDTYVDRKQESEIWRKKYHKFEGGKFYMTSQFIPMRNPEDGIKENPDDGGSANSFYNQSSTAIQPYLDRISGIFRVGGELLTTQGDIDNNNLVYEDLNRFVYDMPWTFSANTTNGLVDVGGIQSYYFGGQWLNMTMYFPQVVWTIGRTNDGDRDQNTGDMWLFDYRDGLNGNAGEWFFEGGSISQELVGGDINTQYYGRADSLATSFVETPREDIVNFNGINQKGLTEYDLQLSGVNLTGNYLYRTPSASGNDVDRNNRREAFKDQAWDTRYYNGTYISNPMFFKGMYNSDCIKLLFDLNFI